MTADLSWHLDASLGLPERKFITDACESSSHVSGHFSQAAALLRCLKNVIVEAPERPVFSVLLLLNSISGWN